MHHSLATAASPLSRPVAAAAARNRECAAATSTFQHWSCRLLVMALPANTVELERHGGTVRRVVALPDGERIATASSHSIISLFSTVTGERLRSFSREGGQGVSGLAALGGDILASGDSGGRLCTWNASSGECLHFEELSGSVRLAALGADRLVVCAMRDVLFFSHDEGRDVTLLHRKSCAHSEKIHDVATHGTRVATASFDRTAAIWCAKTYQRLAVLRGPTVCWVECVAMNAQYILTGSMDSNIRVFDAKTFESVRVLDSIHSTGVSSLTILSNGYVLSSSMDETMELTRLTDSAAVTRLDLPFTVRDLVIMGDGRIAIANGESLMVFTPPGAASRVIWEHAATLLSMLRLNSSRTPLRQTLADVSTGNISPAAARRTLQHLLYWKLPLAAWQYCRTFSNDHDMEKRQSNPL